MCYGILYGMGAQSLSEQLEVSPEEAAVFLDKFKQTYRGCLLIFIFIFIYINILNILNIFIFFGVLVRLV
jgi:hypothetical protein